MFTPCPLCPEVPPLVAAAWARRKSAPSRKAASKTRRAPAPSPRRIDVHHHIAPPAYVEAVEKTKVATPNPWRDEVYKGWSPSLAVEIMDQGGTQTALTTITEGAALARHPERVRIARECNEYAAKLQQEFPGRFGHFATLPMPDVDACLKEIAYALDVLKFDGVDIRTSYDRQWLGDAAWAPIYEELNRRKAVVYSHPHEPMFLRNLLPGVPGSTIEFCTDTSRAIASVIFGGTSTRFPNVRFIFSHSGGTMPFIAERFTRLAKRGDHARTLPKGALPEIRKFYYEVAQAATPWALSSLTSLVPMSQILFGTDFPYRTSKEIGKQLADFGLNPKALAAINRNNAARLFPRYR